MIEFRENDDPTLIELMKRREAEQRASKNFGVVDSREYRTRLETIDAEYQKELDKDIRYRLASIAYEQAENALEAAKRWYAEYQHSMHPQIKWQMQRRLDAYAQVQ